MVCRLDATHYATIRAVGKLDEIMTISEVAQMLRLSKRSIYELTSSRGRNRLHPLPVFRINTSVRFIRSDVEEWVEKLRGKVG